MQNRKLVAVISTVEREVIGVNGDLVIRSPRDLKNFKSVTTGKFIVMGKNTCESLPFKLPNRHSHVITSEDNYESEKCDSSSILDMEHIRRMADDFYGHQTGDIYVIGGASLLSAMHHLIDEVIETQFFCDLGHGLPGDITRIQQFHKGTILDAEAFSDPGAVFLPNPSRFSRGVCGMIMHYVTRN